MSSHVIAIDDPEYFNALGVNTFGDLIKRYLKILSGRNIKPNYFVLRSAKFSMTGECTIVENIPLEFPISELIPGTLTLMYKHIE